MNSSARMWIAIGGILGALGVAFGAFGAHGLDANLQKLGYADADLARRLEIFDTAVKYQMWHALAIVAVGLALAQRDSGWWRGAALLFLIGVALFSGLLKVMTFAGPQWNWLGAVVPIGGVAMIVGWVLLAVGALRSGASEEQVTGR